MKLYNAHTVLPRVLENPEKSENFENIGKNNETSFKNQT